MKFNTISRRTTTAIGIAAVALVLPAAAQAQMSSAEVQTLPPEYQTGPVVEDYSETSVSPDGMETITRTRRIESNVAYPGSYPGGPMHHTEHTQGYEPAYAPAGYPPAGYMPASSVFERDQWLDECERRTRGHGDREKGGIIGGLLGAIAGGIIGNRVSDGERLGGTLIGLGAGGIAGVLIGSVIGGGRDERGEYDCKAALDGYLSQYGYGGPRIATRMIPVPAYQAYPAYPQQGYYGYAQGPAYQSYSYSYAPPQQIVYVPIQYQQQQRVIIRETVREEMIPGATRTVPAPAPRPVPVPPAPPRYIKGN